VVIAPGLLKSELATIRRRGIAEEHEESAPGVACVAAHPDPNDYGLAELSISGSMGGLNTNRLAPAMRTAALGASRPFAWGD
jgi:IclR family transcriptional regulator, acetate operon repressor